MRVPEGYTLEKSLQLNGRCEVVAAVRDADRRPLVLKQYLDDRTARGSRAQREFEALRSVQGDGIVAALALIEGEGAPILVLEHVPGVPFASWVQAGLPSAQAFLVVAQQIADVLARVHEARLVHRDVSPRNICVEPGTLKAHLIDFGMARPLGSSSRGDHDRTGSGFAGALRYSAPEQTGRMGRGIDYRSDLYALGATLYLALTGRPPFDAEDALALVHAHMALVPTAPNQVRPDAPATLSRIVLKLLQKEPQDRYQTARGLKSDLVECLTRLTRDGRLPDDIALGREDAPTRPVFTRKLYGREREAAALAAAYARARQDRTGLVVLSGAAGVGKSSLIQGLRPLVSGCGGYLISGKFDAYRDVPYSGLSAAFESLAHQILAESEERLEHWRTAWRESLGELTSVIVEWVPDFVMIVGECARAPRLGPRETQARLAYAVQRMLQGCATREHPLLLFLDDVQWADSSSISLIEHALSGLAKASLLIVLSHRDDTGADLAPLQQLTERLEKRALDVEHLNVPPLDAAAIVQILSDVLQKAPDAVRSLAERVALKTCGSPLLVEQFVLHLHACGALRFEGSTGWTWDEASIAAVDPPEGAVALMIDKIERLAPEARELLQLVSCLRDEMDVESLYELSGRSHESLDPPLSALLEAGLIVPSPLGFRFAHDRIREAAHELLTEQERARIHYRTGKLLFERMPESSLDERVFEIADHLNRGREHLSEDEREKAVGINLRAGRGALARGATAQSAAYFEHSLALVHDRDDWSTDRPRAFALRWEAANAAFQLRRFDRCIQLLDELDARDLEVLERAQVASRRISTVFLTGSESALQLGLRELRKHGQRWPENPSRLRAALVIRYTAWLFRGPLDERAFPGKPPADPGWLAPLMVLSAIAPALMGNESPLICLVIAYILRCQRSYGAGPTVGLSLAAFAASRFETTGSWWKDLERYTEASARWTERAPDSLKPRSRFSLHYLVGWLGPRRTCIDHLRETSERALELGDIEYAAYSAQNHLVHLLLAGESLASASARIALLQQREHWPGMRAYLAAIGHACELLQAESADTIDWEAEAGRARNALDVRGLRREAILPSLMAFILLGQPRHADSMPRPSRVQLMRLGSLSLDYVLFDGLCAAGMRERSAGAERRRQHRRLRGCMRWLRKQARYSRDAVHMARFLEAECARARSRHERAFELYAQAAQRAQREGYVNHAALIHERHAGLLLATRRETRAALALRQSIALYREWGAAGKARELEAALREVESSAA